MASADPTLIWQVSGAEEALDAALAEGEEEDEDEETTDDERLYRARMEAGLPTLQARRELGRGGWPL
eukprot:3926665-Prymnesium_polylepis.1